MSEDNQICRFLGADTTRFGNLQASGGEEKKGRRSNGKMGMSRKRVKNTTPYSFSSKPPLNWHSK
jgi:hypothetical protein